MTGALVAGFVVLVVAGVAAQVAAPRRRRRRPLPESRELAAVRLQLARTLALCREWMPAEELAAALTITPHDPGLEAWEFPAPSPGRWSA